MKIHPEILKYGDTLHLKIDVYITNTNNKKGIVYIEDELKEQIKKAIYQYYYLLPYKPPYN